MAVNDADNPDVVSYTDPLVDRLSDIPGVSVAMGSLKQLLTWGTANSLWMFPMATSCCGIEFMASMAARVDLDRMGTFVRPTPRQCDVMVVAGTITVKMAPRVKKLWDMMPEPKWCIAMGSCAISGDFYRDIYSVIPGIDTVIPVDVYVPGCPPNPEQLMAGLQRLQEKIKLQNEGKWVDPEPRPDAGPAIKPGIGQIHQGDRPDKVTEAQRRAADLLGLNGNERRDSDFFQCRLGSDIPRNVAFAATPSKAVKEEE